jgi:hypothetical protein
MGDVVAVHIGNSRHSKFQFGIGRKMWKTVRQLAAKYPAGADERD